MADTDEKTRRGTLRQPRATSLSSKLLWLTILFVMIAEVLIFVPSVANTRIRWLQDRLNTAAAAAVVIEGINEMDLPQSIQNDTLMATGTKAIVAAQGWDVAHDRKRSTCRPIVTHQYDLSAVTPLSALADAFDTILFGGDRVIRVYGLVADDPDMIIDLVLEDAQLRHAMLIYGRNVFFCRC
jgi:hypothetical protein